MPERARRSLRQMNAELCRLTEPILYATVVREWEATQRELRSLFKHLERRSVPTFLVRRREGSDWTTSSSVANWIRVERERYRRTPLVLLDRWHRDSIGADQRHSAGGDACRGRRTHGAAARERNHRRPRAGAAPRSSPNRHPGRRHGRSDAVQGAGRGFCRLPAFVSIGAARTAPPREFGICVVEAISTLSTFEPSEVVQGLAASGFEVRRAGHALMAIAATSRRLRTAMNADGTERLHFVHARRSRTVPWSGAGTRP